MIYVGIDVSKDKHDCSILSPDGQPLLKPFSVPNTLEGFHALSSAIASFEKIPNKVKVGLVATGHYSFNILGYLLEKDYVCFVFNPLHTNLYRKSLTLRKTKTDKVDSKIIAKMLLSEVDLKPYSKALYHNEQLKSLSRYRFSKVRERSNLKQQLARLVNILFPELEKLVPSLHLSSVYVLLEEFPGASFIAGIYRVMPCIRDIHCNRSSISIKLNNIESYITVVYKLSVFIHKFFTHCRLLLI